jgi:hypothetical protein
MPFHLWRKYVVLMTQNKGFFSIIIMMEKRCVKYVTNLNIVKYLHEKLTSKYQHGGYISEVLQHSGRKYRTEKQLRIAL